MDQQQVLQVQIDAVNQEVAGIYRAKVANELKVEDAKKPTGNKEADRQLAKLSQSAQTMLLIQERMLTVRNARLDELETQLAAIKPAEDDTPL